MVHERRRLDFSAGAPWKLVAVADTHSKPHPALGPWLETYQPDAILHCGDIGSLDVLDVLSKFAPVHAVRGNIDTHAARLPDALTLDVGDSLRLLVMHIVVAGPRIRADAAKLARTEKASLIVCGHSHVPFLGVDKGLPVFNPGSVGPKRFQLPIVFGTIEWSPKGLKIAHVDVETGKEWTPPAR